MEYVTGFLFSEDFRKMAMVHKQRPDWQKGKLNGIGGKIEPDETPYEAMRREFREEAGLDIDSWVRFNILVGDEHTVNYFYAIGDPEQCQTMTDEPIKVVHLRDLDDLAIIPNLYWIVPMALTMATAPKTEKNKGYVTFARY